MSETVPSVELLEPVEDVGGAAQPLLQVNGLTKHFPVRGDLFSARKTVRAVDNVSFAIAKGETVGIVGESGCGKSTTARLLMHLMKRDAGDIVYDGMQVGRALSLRELRRGMQMVFQTATRRSTRASPSRNRSPSGPRCMAWRIPPLARWRATYWARSACGPKSSPTAIRTRFPVASASASTSPVHWLCRRGS